VDAVSAPSGESGWAPLIDVTHVSLRELFAADDSNLGSCIQRLVDGLDDPDGVISAFQSFPSAP
jgi:FXSXX-COOH protein